MALLYTPVAIITGLCILVIPIIWNLTISAVSSTDPRLANTCKSLGATQTQRVFIYISETRFALITTIFDMNLISNARSHIFPFSICPL